MNTAIVGITGASGAILAKKLLEHLARFEIDLHVISTGHGEEVFRYETGNELDVFLTFLRGEGTKIVRHGIDDMFAPVASGSFGTGGAMVIVPCSMSTAGKLANGCGDNLLVRAADVVLKERERLVIVPRESPVHEVHLQNLLTLSRLGAVIMPPMPHFYSVPKTIDEMHEGIVGRILKTMGLPNELYIKWNGAKP